GCYRHPGCCTSVLYFVRHTSVAALTIKSLSPLVLAVDLCRLAAVTFSNQVRTYSWLCRAIGRAPLRPVTPTSVTSIDAQSSGEDVCPLFQHDLVVGHEAGAHT